MRKMSYSEWIKLQDEHGNQFSVTHCISSWGYPYNLVNDVLLFPCEGNVIANGDERNIPRNWGSIHLSDRASLVNEVARMFEPEVKFSCLPELLPHERITHITDVRQIDTNVKFMSEFLAAELEDEGIVTREFDPPRYKGPMTKYEKEKLAAQLKEDGFDV